MVPKGLNGGAVWSSQPVVDHKTGLLYVSTGNSYSVGKGYCVNPGQTRCRRLPADAYIDSIVRLKEDVSLERRNFLRGIPGGVPAIALTGGGACIVPAAKAHKWR
jgi:hypothetical protein